MSNKSLVLSRINEKLANAPAPQTINEAISTALDALLELKDEQRKREEEEARKRNEDTRKTYQIRVTRTDEAYVLVKAPSAEDAEAFVDKLLEEDDDPHTKFDYSGVSLEIDRGATTAMEDKSIVPDYDVTIQRGLAGGQYFVTK